jgi:hypothetical protein
MGQLAEVGNWQSIGETIVEVLKNREQYVYPRDHIEACFSFKDTVDAYEAIFRKYAKA